MTILPERREDSRLDRVLCAKCVLRPSFCWGAIGQCHDGQVPDRFVSISRTLPAPRSASDSGKLAIRRRSRADAGSVAPLQHHAGLRQLTSDGTSPETLAFTESLIIATTKPKGKTKDSGPYTIPSLPPGRHRAHVKSDRSRASSKSNGC
jgi:hypothetical protein